MDPEAIVTIAGVGVIAGALAVYLIIISGILIKVSSNLDKILNEIIIDIANKTGGLSGVVGSIANDVMGIERAVAGLVPSGGEDAYEERDVSEPEDEVPPPRRRRARARARAS